MRLSERAASIKKAKGEQGEEEGQALSLPRRLLFCRTVLETESISE